MEREEAERAELRKMIMGQSEKKPQINQNDQQQANQGRSYIFNSLKIYIYQHRLQANSRKH